ncbi:MAG: hypothetical protein ACLVEU_19005 [Bacteroides cellulosilyticus]
MSELVPYLKTESIVKPNLNPKIQIYQKIAYELNDADNLMPGSY